MKLGELLHNKTLHIIFLFYFLNISIEHFFFILTHGNFKLFEISKTKTEHGILSSVYFFPFGFHLGPFGFLLGPFGSFWVPFGSFWVLLGPFGVNRRTAIFTCIEALLRNLIILPETRSPHLGGQNFKFLSSNKLLDLKFEWA